MASKASVHRGALLAPPWSCGRDNDRWQRRRWNMWP